MFPGLTPEANTGNRLTPDSLEDFRGSFIRYLGAEPHHVPGTGGTIHTLIQSPTLIQGEKTPAYTLGSSSTLARSLSPLLR